MAEPFDDGEIAALRADTPGCTDDLIHLNHAGTSPPPRVVLDTQLDYLQEEATRGGYEVADRHAEQSAAAYAAIADLIGAHATEIARAGSAAEAWNRAFWSVPMEPGQRIIVDDHAYGANAVAFIHAARTRGVVVDRVPTDATGQVSVDAIAARLDRADDVAMLALTHVPTNGGLVNPAAEVGALTRAADVIYLLDACQSVGQLVVDVDEIGCDFLAVTGRKYLRGPRGTGFLYARSSVLDRTAPSQPDHHGAAWNATDSYELRDDARRYEYWEHSPAGWLALGEAAAYADRLDMARIEATVAARADELRTLLTDCGMTVYDVGSKQCGIVTTAHSAVEVHRVQDGLVSAGVTCSLTSVGSSRYDVERRSLPQMVRLSLHYLTTRDELDRAVSTLRMLLPS
ncbi:MAG: aminotransferase class V-fold PLP-dependent enzyme [Ilumatobacter sp.]|nr:aminotransferase class V-fold PLP-dependent enzyme [Ilumatobacter sp.]